MGPQTATRNKFEQIAEEFAARFRRGEHPAIAEYCERYPEHASEIRELFPALAMMEKIATASSMSRTSACCTRVTQERSAGRSTVTASLLAFPVGVPRSSGIRRSPTN